MSFSGLFQLAEYHLDLFLLQMARFHFLWLIKIPLCVCVCVCVCVCAKLLQSRPTLCNPMDCSLLGSSVHGILQA